MRTLFHLRPCLVPTLNKYADHHTVGAPVFLHVNYKSCLLLMCTWEQSKILGLSETQSASEENGRRVLIVDLRIKEPIVEFATCHVLHDQVDFLAQGVRL